MDLPAPYWKFGSIPLVLNGGFENSLKTFHGFLQNSLRSPLQRLHIDFLSGECLPWECKNRNINAMYTTYITLPFKAFCPTLIGQGEQKGNIVRRTRYAILFKPWSIQRGLGTIKDLLISSPINSKTNKNASKIRVVYRGFRGYLLAGVFKRRGC